MCIRWGDLCGERQGEDCPTKQRLSHKAPNTLASVPINGTENLALDISSMKTISGKLRLGPERHKVMAWM